MPALRRAGKAAWQLRHLLHFLQADYEKRMRGVETKCKVNEYDN
jgi:hypothetical protein